MLTLIKNAHIFSPLDQGVKDILIANERIEKIDDNITLSGVEHSVIDTKGAMVTPGFIDKHVHITGGGGEYGFASLAKEVSAEDLLKVGTTTVLGILGTDGTVKEVTTLYGKAKQLDYDMTAYMLSGSYSYPPKTITGTIEKDLVFVDKCIGCKLAVSDDRGSFPTDLELKRLLSEIWRGAMTGGKRGILHIHLGVLDSRVEQLINIAKEAPRLIPHISLTHCAREEKLFNQVIEFAKMGGNLDITTGGSRFTDIHKIVEKALAAGLTADQITFSSDGQGGIRHIDPETGIESYGTGSVDSNLIEFRVLVNKGILPVSEALKLLTTTPARELALDTKGQIAEGFDADILIWGEDLTLSKVIAKGVVKIQ